MGRHSGPNRRFEFRAALRLTAIEGVLLLVGLAFLMIGIVLARSAWRSADIALNDGECVTAEAVRINRGHSVRWGRTAELSFTLHGQRLNGTLHYDSEDKLSSGVQLPICVSPDNNAIWVVNTTVWNGESSAVWWREQAGDATIILGIVSLIVFGARHPWLADDDDDG